MLLLLEGKKCWYSSGIVSNLLKYSLYKVYTCGWKENQRNPSAYSYLSVYIISWFIYLVKHQLCLTTCAHDLCMVMDRVYYVWCLMMMYRVNVRKPCFTQPTRWFVDCFCFGFIYRQAFCVWGLTASCKPVLSARAITMSNLDGRKCVLIWLLSLLLSKSLFFTGEGVIHRYELALSLFTLL